MSTFTQVNRLLSLSTPLGDDVLLLTGFRGEEALSRPFVYNLSVLSERTDITATDIVGKNVTWQINHTDRDPRYFNGYVSRLSSGGRGLHGLRAYQLEVVPWLWFLTKTADSRIYFPDLANKNVKDVLAAVFAAHKFADCNDKNLVEQYHTHEHWVQYRETAFNFVSRLLEDAGIFYYWAHANGKHTMMLCDRKTHYQDCPEKFIPFVNGGTRSDSQIHAWRHDWECRSGQVAHGDYNFETPKTRLLTDTRTVLKLPDAATFELFDYPGDFQVKGDGDLRIKVRMEEEEAPFHVVQGGSNCASFFPGGKFTLTDHEVEEESDQTYVLTSVAHDATDTTFGNDGDSSYTNRFRCIPESVTYRPQRLTPRPTVQGSQTAVVVGPPKEEIHTDQYGRIKVQFHWDRRGEMNEHSSCWVRVATPWAGKNWGMIHIPRVGQEVVVDFLEGDPNRPLVIGSVYNAEQMPPYTLPAGRRISGVKSNSTPGGGGFNEISFDDTKGKEKITLHGQYDMATTILHDDSQTVKNNRSVTIEGTSTHEIKGDTKITITKGNYTHKVSTGTATYTVEGAVEENYNSTQTTTVKNDITIKSSESEITVDGSKKITLVSGASQITLEKEGTITIKAKHIILSADTDISAGAPEIGIVGTTSAVLAGGKDGGQAVECNAAKVMLGGKMIVSEAQGNHVIKGTLVKIN